MSGPIVSDPPEQKRRKATAAMNLQPTQRLHTERQGAAGERKKAPSPPVTLEQINTSVGLN
jgi:hypothetical protein